jgi:hypothetical protein
VFTVTYDDRDMPIISRLGRMICCQRDRITTSALPQPHNNHLRSGKPLIRDGLIRTNPDPSDHRAKQLYLTEMGRAKRTDAAMLWRDAQRRFDNFFGKDDAAAMRQTMNRVSSREFEESFLGGAKDGSSPPAQTPKKLSYRLASS